MSSSKKSILQDKVITRGAQEGYCRICKQYRELTRDHVPPKGSIKVSPVELRTLGQDKNTKPVISQDGTNFRTICSKCNNTFLGTEYDPELNKISKKIGSLIKSSLLLPSQISIAVKPQRLARAIIGHILASNYHPAASDIKENLPFPEALREYFLDRNAFLSKKINIYYWFYPGHREVILHGAAMGFWKFSERPLIFSLIKFFPIAYWITWEEPQDLKINAPTLLQDRNIGIDQVEEIQIKLSNFPRLDFPEHP
jgi:hypothetical protein